MRTTTANRRREEEEIDMVLTLPVSTPIATQTGELVRHYDRVRADSEFLCEPLEVEDFLIQPMDDASPTKWHLAHTTWFFETFLLERYAPDFRPFHPRFKYLFNSYYNSVGEMHKRPLRGLLSRPTVAEVMAYRHHVDDAMRRLLRSGDEVDGEMAELITTGLHHEKQHQELILTDIKSVFGANPLRPAYRTDLAERPQRYVEEMRWIGHSGGLVNLGRDRDPDTFAFDNETPRHRVHLEPFEMSHRLVTCGEFIQFIEDGGYDKATLWLSDGWSARNNHGWTAPLYWEQNDGEWHHLTLGGLERVRPEEPVCHVSFYEADAFARWAGARLPLESEWEVMATALTESPKSADKEIRFAANLRDRDRLHPSMPEDLEAHVQQLFGDVWEWTSSPYTPYPGYRPLEGPLGEYNGKFMCNQMILRGGSCVTPRDHLRVTYRNFWSPETRFQFSGFRLARHTESRKDG